MVNNVMYSNAQKNVKAIFKLFDDLEVAIHYGGGCNNNAADAQKEIRMTFENIMAELDSCDEEVAGRV